MVAWMILIPASAMTEGSPLQISEFAAEGAQDWKDEDGDTSDWIEIQNVSRALASLEGWTLGDSSRRRPPWRFPSTNLPPGQFLMVFASGKNRREPGGRLHLWRSPKSDLSKPTPGGEKGEQVQIPWNSGEGSVDGR